MGFHYLMRPLKKILNIVARLLISRENMGNIHALPRLMRNRATIYFLFSEVS